MKLYLVHCGYYDPSVAQGTFESHVNFFVAAQSFEDARIKARSIESFSERKMHIDGLQEINAIDGYQIELRQDEKLNSESIIVSQRHRDLAPKPN